MQTVCVAANKTEGGRCSKVVVCRGGLHHASPTHEQILLRIKSFCFCKGKQNDHKDWLISTHLFSAVADPWRRVKESLLSLRPAGLQEKCHSNVHLVSKADLDSFSFSSIFPLNHSYYIITSLLFGWNFIRSSQRWASSVAIHLMHKLPLH